MELNEGKIQWETFNTMFISGMYRRGECVLLTWERHEYVLKTFIQVVGTVGYFWQNCTKMPEKQVSLQQHRNKKCSKFSEAFIGYFWHMYHIFKKQHTLNLEP